MGKRARRGGILRAPSPPEGPPPPPRRSSRFLRTAAKRDASCAWGTSPRSPRSLPFFFPTATPCDWPSPRGPYAASGSRRRVAGGGACSFYSEVGQIREGGPDAVRERQDHAGGCHGGAEGRGDPPHDAGARGRPRKKPGDHRGRHRRGRHRQLGDRRDHGDGEAPEEKVDTGFDPISLFFYPSLGVGSPFAGPLTPACQAFSYLETQGIRLP